MRGGAIPLLAWGTLLLVLAVGNWIWDHRTVPGLAATAAAAIVYAFAAFLWLARRESIRRGPPEHRRVPEAIPTGSLAAVVIGLAIGCIVFGLVWAKFLVFFGAGVLVFALGRLALEVRAERRAVDRTLAHDREEGP